MFAPGEFDGQELGHTTDEITGAGRDLWIEAVRVALVIAEVVAKEVARRRQQQWEQASKDAARKIWEERQRAEPVLRAALDEDFWKDPTPQDIGRAWQTAIEWGPSDPEAAAVLDHMRRELADRYGLVPNDVQLNVADLSKALALGAPALRAEAAVAREDAERWGETSSLYVIRDPNDPEQILHQGELRTVPGERLEAAAARELKEWARTHGRELDGTIGIEAVTNDGTPGGGSAAAQVTGERAEALIKDEAQWQRRLVSGEEKGSLEEVHHAVLAEWDRTEDAARLLGEGTEGYDGLREATARLALQARAVEAEMRGEEPRHVYQGATLRSKLAADEWWRTATASQVAGVWSQVGGWPDSQAKRETTQLLQNHLFVRHGLDLESTTPADAVAELLGGAESDTPAATYADRAADARAKAEELFRKSADAATDSARLTREADEMAALPGADLRAAEDKRNQALVAAGQSYLYSAQAVSAGGEAERFEATADAQAEKWNMEIEPEELREAFRQRFGHELDPASVEKLTVSASRAAAAAVPSSGAGPAPSPGTAPESSVRETSGASGEMDPEGAGAIRVAGAGLQRSARLRRGRPAAAGVPQAPPMRSRVPSASSGIG